MHYLLLELHSKMKNLFSKLPLRKILYCLKMKINVHNLVLEMHSKIEKDFRKLPLITVLNCL